MDSRYVIIKPPRGNHGVDNHVIAPYSFNHVTGMEAMARHLKYPSGHIVVPVLGHFKYKIGCMFGCTPHIRGVSSLGCNSVNGQGPTF